MSLFTSLQYIFETEELWYLDIGNDEKELKMDKIIKIDFIENFAKFNIQTLEMVSKE